MPYLRYAAISFEMYSESISSKTAFTKLHLTVSIHPASAGATIAAPNFAIWALP
jgi:hypothetical protein